MIAGRKSTQGISPIGVWGGSTNKQKIENICIWLAKCVACSQSHDRVMIPLFKRFYA
jgi:hypothetical protein